MLKALVMVLFAGIVTFGAMPSAIAHSNSPYSLNPSFAQPFAQVMAAKKSLFSFSGTRPSNLGVKDGKLAACPGSPNCVNSQASNSDAEHFIEPFAYSGSAVDAIAKLKGIIEATERTEIITATDSYLYAEFTTPLMGYVDDVEFFADDAAKVIHVRSASRLGQSDLGLNRKRIEALRTQFAA
ncbi:DUF1499 domain-containing protein [Leptolyngbya sp. AN02str]|uniref:DUF1499 domain-containing protein n=1 Tax=Leptolyngbya sp. AN02str TaxID=3423363 RepID=UPI003D312434